jgi:hypothetical protein
MEVKSISFTRSNLILLVQQGIGIEVLFVDNIVNRLVVLAQVVFLMGRGESLRIT